MSEVSGDIASKDTWQFETERHSGLLVLIIRDEECWCFERSAIMVTGQQHNRELLQAKSISSSARKSATVKTHLQVSINVIHWSFRSRRSVSVKPNFKMASKYRAHEYAFFSTFFLLLPPALASPPAPDLAPTWPRCPWATSPDAPWPAGPPSRASVFGRASGRQLATQCF
jgi:hypothetical protein